MKEGWLWLSILKMQASPSPMSITPAFSPGPLDHPGRAGRQLAQVQARGFVGTMLVPHRRENAELGAARHPADELDDALVFVGLQAVFGDDFRGDLGLGWAVAVA